MVSLAVIPFLWGLLKLYSSVETVENDKTSIKEMELDCRRLICGEKSRCIYRKNWCRSPPCPSMIFCSDEENPLIPSSCDNVRCSRSYRCITRYVKDQRTGLYTDIKAHCVAELEIKRYAAYSCADFKCPRLHLACILREPKCRKFPCRILPACIPGQEVKRLHLQCNHMNCSSPDNCYLRRPYNCTINGCSHDAACLHSLGEKSVHHACRGIICSTGSKCQPAFDHCNVRRSCNARPGCPLEFGNSSVTNDSNGLLRVTPGISGIPGVHL